MNKSKQQTTQTQAQSQAYNNTNTFGFVAPPETSDTSAVRDFDFTGDPRIPYTFARAYQRAEDTFNRPMAGYHTPQLRDAILRATSEDIGVEEAQAQREENFGLQGLDYARKLDVAQMTQPRMVQTGGSGTSSGSSSGSGTAQQNSGILGPLTQGGSAIGSALIM